MAIAGVGYSRYSCSNSDTSDVSSNCRYFFLNFLRVFYERLAGDLLSPCSDAFSGLSFLELSLFVKKWKFVDFFGLESALPNWSHRCWRDSFYPILTRVPEVDRPELSTSAMPNLISYAWDLFSSLIASEFNTLASLVEREAARLGWRAIGLD